MAGYLAPNFLWGFSFLIPRVPRDTPILGVMAGLISSGYPSCLVSQSWPDSWCSSFVPGSCYQQPTSHTAPVSVGSCACMAKAMAIIKGMKNGLKAGLDYDL